MKRIAITGGAGQIAYSLLFRLASGEVFGPSEEIALHILEVKEALPQLSGVVMELEDCAFPLLKEIHIGSDPKEIFHKVDWVIFVGAKPRGPGMERKDLLSENGKIFSEQGMALSKVNKNAKILVVGNPCNTNCLIAMHQDHGLSKNQFFAMTRLDENRAKAMLAKKASIPVKKVSRMCIWGNHSSTQVPDFSNALLDGHPVEKMIQDEKWLKETFIEDIQKRGAKVIAARGKSSAASAAQAILDMIRSLHYPTAKGDFYSMALDSTQNPYGIQPGLIFSFPCRTSELGHVEIVENLILSPFIREKIQQTQDELIEEKKLISDLL